MLIVFNLFTGKTEKFQNVQKLIKKYPCISEKRVEWCINTGRRWKGLLIDIVEERK